MVGRRMEMEVKASEEILKGTYANNVLITHTPAEFLLDFMSIFPPKGVLGARVIITPGHAKRLVTALQENIAIYEKNFGAIKEVKEPLIAPSKIN